MFLEEKKQCFLVLGYTCYKRMFKKFEKNVRNVHNLYVDPTVLESPADMTINTALMSLIGFLIGGSSNLISAAVSADLGMLLFSYCSIVFNDFGDMCQFDKRQYGYNSELMIEIQSLFLSNCFD